MSFKWLQQPYPRYLRQTSTLEIQCHEQEVNHMAFANDCLGLQDCLVLSDGQARVRVYCMLLGNKAAACIWQSPGYESVGPETSFSRDMGLWQGLFVAIAAQRSIQLQSLAALESTSGAACSSIITLPLEGCYNVAWDSAGSFVVLCTAIRRLRLYHDQGQACTEVDSVSDTSMAVFAPGDATMLYCITPQGVKLRSLRALPECADFCQAVDRSNLHMQTRQGKRRAAEVPKHGSNTAAFIDPASSCWLPTSPVPPPVLQPRPASQALPSCQAAMPSLAIACGCTEDQPCTAGCPNMQNSSTTLRTPLAAVTAANGQTAKQLAGQGVEAFCTSDATPVSVATCQTSAATGKTFSRHKRQLGSIGKRKADLSWLQGADELPALGSRHQQLSFQAQPWANVGGDAVDPQPHSDSSVIVEAGPKLQNGVVTWYTADAQGEKATFDTKHGRFQYSFQGHTGAVTQVLPLSDGLHILTSSNDNTHKLWTVAGKGLCTFKPPAGAGTGFASALSACQKYVLAGHGSSVIVWDVNQLLKTAGEMPESQSHDNHLLQLNDHGCMITAVACSDSIMASADSSGKVILHFSS